MTVFLQSILNKADLNWEIKREYDHSSLDVQWEINDEVVAFDFVLDVKKKGSTNAFVLCYSNALHDMEAGYVSWTVFENNEWKEVIPIHSPFEKTYTFSFLTDQLLLGWKHVSVYSQRTMFLAAEFPVWTAIRQNRESAGHQLLNSAALNAERFQGELENILNQFSVQTINPNDQPWVMLYQLPDVLVDSIVFYRTDDEMHPLFQNEIPIYDQLHDFYTNLEAGMIIDYGNQIAYSRALHETIDCKIGNETTRLYGTPHLIWSHLDEWASLVGLNRRTLETNASLHQRIKTYFTRPSSSTSKGLIEAIARETNSIFEAVWKNDEQFFIIPHKDAIRESIQINHQYVRADQFYEGEVIALIPLNENKEHVVSWIRGFEFHDPMNQEPAWVQKAKDAFGFSKEWWLQILTDLAKQFRNTWQYGVWNETYFDRFFDQTKMIPVPAHYDVPILPYQNKTR